ncbi:MAG TPA: hypothetical protein VMH61_04255 [Candidatus Acidoferrales bacterium]|nr:hypothetical protein [Candidatus Acidoferrales bacterium]
MPAPPRLPRELPGLAAAAAGLALLAVRGLVAAALGAELLAVAFWSWSRLGADRSEQLARWAWLRRPAMALWLASALALALPAPRAIPPSAAPAAAESDRSEIRATPPREGRDPLAPLRALEAAAVLWAGLELIGALPLSRPFPDLTGPLTSAGPWLPAVLPAAGFLVLWRQAPVWLAAPWLREAAELLLLVAAMLAVLRAYTRHSWTASLRWLAVFDSALAALLVALDAVPPEIAFLLWFGAAGGRLIALGAEIRGAAGRRGPQLASLWRAAGWTAGAALSWPLLVEAGFSGGRFRPLPFVLLGAPVLLAARLSLGRLIEAPERRAFARRDPARALGIAGALATLLVGPAALLLAWWAGYEATFPGAWLALVPAALGAWPRSRRAESAAEVPALLRASLAASAPAREFALAIWRSVVGLERRLAGTVVRAVGAFGAPARDLHTGDAQEYLLLLVGVAMLALLLPLLR